MRTNKSQDLIFMNSFGSSPGSNECNSVSCYKHKITITDEQTLFTVHVKFTP